MTISRPPSSSVELNYLNIAVLSLLHIGALAALFFPSTRDIAIAAAMYWLTICVGVSMGYHRLLTHRSFKAPKWLEYLLTLCAVLSMQGGPVFWVGTHRLHHSFSDRPHDPHSPQEGFWWAYMGWLLLGETKHNNLELMSRHAPDLIRDPFYRWLSKWHWVPVVASALVFFAIGGWKLFLWAWCFRITAGIHAAGLTNAVTHTFGTRDFDTVDESRNNVLVALVSFGEGWHNNHHKYPGSARFGLKWWQLDIAWLHILALKWLGLAGAVKSVAP